MTSPSTTGRANRLIDESSPYLLQHAYNPVDWYPWGEEAFRHAREEDKPVFLSVGYSTCHWCHVMERESFENDRIAELLNREFIPIKVDREERPDIDGTYMQATQMMTGRGGWPNSVWLTPEGKPWFAGTYYPPEDRDGVPGFATMLRRLAGAWHDQRQHVLEQADRVAEAVRHVSSGDHLRTRARLGQDGIDRAIEHYRRAFDPRAGGFGGAPKFPPHGALRLLLAEHVRHGEAELLRMATRTLDAMSAGGIHDHVGGGFHRYSTDAAWFVPHFEKMLYDNAQLLRIYADAWRVTGDERYRRTAVGIVEWLDREMTHDSGGFFSAIDADSEGEEGKFYVWALDEIMAVLGQEEGALFARCYGATGGGNYRDEATGRPTGANILHLPRPIETAAQDEGLPPDELRRRLADAREKLLHRRERRERPCTDDKVLTAWNGLMIGALSHAGRILDRPGWIESASQAADFLLSRVRREQRLCRSWREGTLGPDACLNDYAFLAEGLIDLHDATGEPPWLQRAEELLSVLDRHYTDPVGAGYYLTADDQEELLTRAKDPFDSEIPSGNGSVARARLRLAERTGRVRHAEAAGRMLAGFAGVAERVPHGVATLLEAAGMYSDRSPAQAGPEQSGAPHRSTQGPVTVEVLAEPPSVRPGARATLRIRVTIDEGWHVNSAEPGAEHLEPFSVDLTSGPLALDAPRFPAGEIIRAGDDEVSVYAGSVEAVVPARVSEDATHGGVPPKLTVRVQPCRDDGACLTPQTHELTVPLDVQD